MSNSTKSLFHQSDLDPMTLALELDLDMAKMYYHTKTEVLLATHSEVIARMDKQTDIQYENIFPHFAVGNYEPLEAFALRKIFKVIKKSNTK